MPVAIVTGASRGLGLALTRALAEDGWRVIADARGAGDLRAALAGVEGVTAIPGDVNDAAHRRALVQAAGDAIDLLVNNASALGPSPLPRLADLPLDAAEDLLRTNVIAPLALIQDALPRLAAGARIVNVTSDAAVEPYPTWGGYATSKAALEQLTAILGAEHPGLRVYAVDPGDMRTRMHQDAFPGEDISDRPLPEASVPGLLVLAAGRVPSGRYGAQALAPARARAVTVLAATQPPEAEGRDRDAVRLLVAHRATGAIEHARFHDLPDFLAPGDLLVVNTSGTLPAAVPARRANGESVQLRVSTPAPPGDGGDDRWIVELRSADGTRPHGGARERVDVPNGTATLVAPYRGDRLHVAQFDLEEPLPAWLARHGRPIRYDYVPREWPLAAYQTAFATEPGSAEMPSAARPFTPALVTRLVSAGVLIAPIVLHTGVSSPERHETPYPERFRVPGTTARLVDSVRLWGGRVIAVGTTVVRALETRAPAGWTELVVTPERGLTQVDGLITGWHEPEASHLQLLEAAAGRELLERSYAQAEAHGYRWHEFGDSHLILP